MEVYENTLIKLFKEDVNTNDRYCGNHYWNEK